ncbi:MAG: PKD domain-containing protein [Candidatus Bipolaricaulia bacterium]
MRFNYRLVWISSLLIGAVLLAGCQPPDNPPSGSFTFTPAFPKEGEQVTFNASGSFDSPPSVLDLLRQLPPKSISSYSWTFGDGGSGSGKIVTHTYNSSGDYQVILTVSDNIAQESSTTKTVTVRFNSPPDAFFTTSPSNPLPDEIITFDASLSFDLAPEPKVISTYNWDFGDGASGSGQIASHTYASAGGYQATLTVIDDLGKTNPTTKPVTVIECLDISSWSALKDATNAWVEGTALNLLRDLSSAEMRASFFDVSGNLIGTWSDFLAFGLPAGTTWAFKITCIDCIGQPDIAATASVEVGNCVGG